MTAPKFLVRSIRFYFLVFLGTVLALLAFVDLSLYREGQNIRETVQKRLELHAEKELQTALQNSLNTLEKELKTISEWDEVHQQFHDSSYYFYWHDYRLQESGYYKPFYKGFELYNEKKYLLTSASPDKRLHEDLPSRISNFKPYLIVKQNMDARLLVFAEVKQRGSEEVIGYIGIAADFFPMLFTLNNFNYINRATLKITAKHDIPLANLMEYLEYQPLENTLSDYLWQLIKGFIIELIVIMIMLSLIISMFFNITIYRPLNTISGYLNTLKSHPKDIHPMPQNTFFLKEFEELKNTLHDYHSDLQHTQALLDLQNQTVWDQARRDGLTNVLNRRAFDEAWSESIDGYERYGTPVTFILFDCDFFKALNDTYGHDVGDDVIRLTATTLQKSLPIGIPSYRIGGDEFAVIIQDCEPKKSMKIAEASLAALESAPFGSLGIKENLTFSVGLSSTRPDGTNDIAKLPRQADIAMYKAKESLRDKIQCYHQSLESDSLTLISNNLVNTIVEGIHTGSNIELHYQPIREINNQDQYYEVLLRMRKESEYIFPKEIFTVVDRRRLEIELDKQVITQVKKSLINNIIPKGSGLSINVSGKTLLQPFFPDYFRILKPFLKDHTIVLEITENSLIDHMDYATEVLNSLRADGFKIALDDFGNGYSSIRYLAHMPVDIVKFDMTMTQALMSEDQNTQNIIRTTAHMILNSGYALVMEGIETEEMLKVAKESGATHVQGYLLGRPDKNPQPLPTSKT